MSTNPYQSPLSSDGSPAAGSRTPYILAGIGALMASLYWGGLTLLIAIGVSGGSVSGFQMVLPILLIGFYAVRAFQLFQGQKSAAKSVLWLHGVGGAFAILQIVSGNPIAVVLQVIKLVIHVFGAITAYLAYRSTPG